MDNLNYEKSAFLNNLLPFMNRDYLIELLKYNKDIKDIKIEINQFYLPSKIKYL